MKTISIMIVIATIAFCSVVTVLTLDRVAATAVSNRYSQLMELDK